MSASIQMTRRQFLRAAAVTTAGLCLAGCSISLPSSTSSTENYYVTNQKAILKEIRELNQYVQKAAQLYMDEDEAAAILDESLQDFTSRLPELPYIGGGKNELTINLYQAAAGLSFYQTMLAHNRTLEETGEILYRAYEDQMSAMPMRGVSSKVFMSELAQKKIEEEGAISQQRQYSEDWVFNYVSGNGTDFDYGIDYTECGICKYFKAQNAAELTPYLCLLDFPLSEILDTGLIRTSTLAHGADRCDFRFKSHRPVQREWTPDFLKGN